MVIRNSNGKANKVNPGFIPVNKYRAHLERAKNSLNYYSFFRPYQLIMPRLDCMFIQDLTNLASMPGTTKAVFDGKDYFLATEDFLFNSGSRWSPTEQKDRLKSLREKGYVETMKKGVPPCRWVWINYEKIEDDLDKALGEEHNQDENIPFNQSDSTDRSVPSGTERSGPSGTEPIKKEESKKKEEYTPSRAAAKPPSAAESDEKRWAKRLYEILRSYNCHNPSTKSLKSWEREFSILKGTRNPDEINKALEWYSIEDHFKDTYTPKLYSAKDFCSRFPKLLDAMARYEQNKRRERSERSKRYSDDDIT